MLRAFVPVGAKVRMALDHEHPAAGIDRQARRRHHVGLGRDKLHLQPIVEHLRRDDFGGES
ncbi:MAG: hypothetical protein MUF06_24315 [Pirellulaceae bacterium]|nr:hypothetical protein [Pirellulaceae bacterium]